MYQRNSAFHRSTVHMYRTKVLLVVIHEWKSAQRFYTAATVFDFTVGLTVQYTREAAVKRLFCTVKSIQIWVYGIPVHSFWRHLHSSYSKSKPISEQQSENWITMSDWKYKRTFDSSTIQQLAWLLSDRFALSFVFAMHSPADIWYFCFKYKVWGF